MQILQSDGFRAFLKLLGIHHMLEWYFRTFPKTCEFGDMVYVVDSLEGWLVQKEIFQERIYDGVFDLGQVQTFCDFGCNRGYFSVWLASRIGASAKGLLVEANPHLVNQVADLMRKNHLAGCRVINGAVGAGMDGGTVEFLIPPTDVGAGLKDVAAGVLKNDRCEVQSVPALNAGRLWAENFGAGTRCHLLKVDIEGAEWKFMGEEKEFLSLVDKMVLEVHTKMGDEAGLLEMVRSAGFVERTRHVAGDGVYLLFAERQN